MKLSAFLTVLFLAAGAAAAQLLRAGGDDFRKVDTAALRASLKAAGAFLPDPE